MIRLLPSPIFHPIISRATATVLILGALGAVVPGLRPAQTAEGTPEAPEAIQPREAKNLFPLAAGRIFYRLTTTEKVPSRGTATLTWFEHGQRFRLESHVVTQQPHSKPPKKLTWVSWVIADDKKLDMMLPTPILPGQKHRVLRVQRPIDLSSKYSNMLLFVPPPDLVMGKITGSSNILGKPCTVHSLTRKEPNLRTDFKLWIWQGIVLRSETTHRHKTLKIGSGKPEETTVRETCIATNLNPNVHFSPALFRIPTGYSISEIEKLPGR